MMKICGKCRHYGKCDKKDTHCYNSNYAEQCGNFELPPITNYERIKQMSVEELARFINTVENSPCYACMDKGCNGDSSNANKCVDGIKKWLESEAAENVI